MYDLNLLDETLDKNQSQHNHLSIQTSLNGLSFCVLDLIRLKYIAFRHYSEFPGDNFDTGIAEILKTDDLLTLPYKSVSHIFVGDKCTLVPSQYFDEQKVSSLFNLVFHSNGNEEIYYNSLNDNVVSLFGYPANLVQNLRQSFPNVKVFHHTTSFIETLLADSQKITKHKCMVVIHNNILNIGIAHQKRLVFFNTFKVRSNADIIYYILGVLEQFELSPKYTDVFFSADIKNHDELFAFLNDFLHHVKFIKPSDQFSYSYLFDDLHLTRFANLFNIALCG